jgi:hypothetical protein
MISRNCISTIAIFPKPRTFLSTNLNEFTKVVFLIICIFNGKYIPHHFYKIYHIFYRVTRPLVSCVCFVDRCLYFEPFLFAIVLSVLLRFMDSDFPCGISELLLQQNQNSIFVVATTQLYLL